MVFAMGFFCASYFYLLFANKDSDNTNNAQAYFFHLLSSIFEIIEINARLMIMKNIIVFIFVMAIPYSGFSQNEILEASIDNTCNVKPAKINVPNGKTASSFVVASLISGNNCYSGAKFTDKGFVIKNSAGDVVYRYQINKDGQVFEPNGALKEFKLSSGIYQLYVDGGKGAYVKLKFHTI